MEYNYSKDDLLNMYHHLKRGRLFTLKMHDCVFKGLIRSSFHSPHGQEAIGVGIMTAMKDKDWLGYTHRLQTALIMRYGLKEFIGELFGLRIGERKGTAFDFHLTDMKPDGKRIGLGLGTLGASYPLNAGIAYGLKLKKKDEIMVSVHGDSGCSEGACYEAWNLIAMQKLPMVVVIENNGWGMTVPQSRQSVNPDISDKAAACGLPAQIVDGTDILAIRNAMDTAIAKARNNEPSVIEMKCIRWDAHFFGQDNSYRDDADDIKYAMENKDPVLNYEKFLLDRGVIDQAFIDKKTEEINKEMDEAIEICAASEKPRAEDCINKDFVYASPETGGDL